MPPRPLSLYQLNHQRLHAQLCDCVVLVGGQTFQAHRSILAACSSHFRALLSSSEEVVGPGADRGPHVMELDPEVVTPERWPEAELQSALPWHRSGRPECIQHVCH
uniref:BTB domain-containing protein n=1 Tax=Stegastes partitus TaxID=144197 RepID=A0A3B4ZTG8_9TELE